MAAAGKPALYDVAPIMSTLAEAKVLLRQGRIDDAERMFEQVLGQSPRDIEALNAVALAALRKSDPRRALALLEQAVALQPAEPMSHYHLGRARSAMGDVQGSLVSYATAVRLRPAFHVARLHLLVTCLAQFPAPFASIVLISWCTTIGSLSSYTK